MDRLTIPHGALVFVGDGQRALFLRNDGDDKFPSLTTERVFKDENPPTHDQGTDRPGRAFKRAHTNRRAGMDTADWHELEKERFSKGVASALERLVQAEKVTAIVVVAPPRTLAELRQAFHADVKKRIIAEVDKDLTQFPVWEIQRHLVA